MTPKEKAKELVDKMNGFTFEDCRQNALRCVDEILKSAPNNPINYTDVNGYWQEVKTEIEKL